MFNKLRIRLTLFIIVVISLLLIMISGMFVFESTDFISAEIEHEMWMSAFNQGTTPNFQHTKEYIRYSYARVDTAGKIVDKSTNSEIPDEHLKALVDKALSNKNYMGQIQFDKNHSYIFLKVILDSKQGYTIVFTDSEAKNKVLHRFVIGIVIIIVISLILAFIASLLITHKTLIPIKKAWKLQTEFTADASHELRTPLAIIQTNLELIMGNPEETVSSQQKWLGNIHAESTRMSKLVDNLLTLSRSDANQQVLDKSHFMLDQALIEAILPFEPVATNCNIILNSFLEPKIEIYGDKTLIKRLMVILLDNAIKYTGENGHINIELNKRDSSAEISITDTGDGIGKEHLDRIFDRFYRVDKARTRNQGGSGLGLAIAKWIVNEHSGTIQVESTVGKGTTFIITIPLITT